MGLSFANHLVIGTAVSPGQAVLRAVTGIFFISDFSTSVLSTLPATGCLQTELIKVMAATGVALTQVVTATIRRSSFLKFKAPALARSGDVSPGGVR